MQAGRKIIHIDMDAFYASIEILDHPEYKDVPLIVGGSPDSRGVVAAASYAARKYGIRSAMSCSRAKQLCPKAVFIRPRIDHYKQVSRFIHRIFNKYTDQIEALALDEAWLDVTENKLDEPSATLIARQIKEQILKETQLTCSAGISYNKFLSKMATEVNKPNGLFVIRPEEAQDFILKLDVRKLPYVGKVTEQKLNELGIKTCSELYQKDELFLTQHLGKFGSDLYQRVRGIDDRPVESSRERKQISVENTFDKDLLYGSELLEELRGVADEQWGRMEKKADRGRTLVLKIKFHNFEQITRSMTHPNGYWDRDEIFEACQKKLEELCGQEYPDTAIRLIGVGLTNLESLEHSREKDTGQLEMFGGSA